VIPSSQCGSKTFGVYATLGYLLPSHQNDIGGTAILKITGIFKQCVIV
jgi:hypothetical protein